MSSNYDYLFKILLVGDVGTGKSSLLTRLYYGVFHDKFVCTIGVGFQVRTINVDDKVVKVQIFDQVGQERFKTITNTYYRSSHGVLLVYNIDDRQSFVNLENWREQINKNAKDNVVKLLIGNKCDLDGDRQVDYDKGKAYADDMGMQFFETSAKTGENTEEALFWIIREIKKKLELNRETEKRGNKVDIRLQPEGKLKGCWT